MRAVLVDGAAVRRFFVWMESPLLAVTDHRHATRIRQVKYTMGSVGTIEGKRIHLGGKVFGEEFLNENKIMIISDIKNEP